jgi:P27 family predicted phage terminase small subunit
MWDKIWSAGHWLHEEDEHLVTMLALAQDELEAYQAQIKTDGLMVRGAAGGVVAHGLIREVRQTRAQIIKILSMLGFSPSDRMRLGIQEVKRANALLDLKAKAQKNAGR